MASQEPIPASLPDTQNADALTQSQGVSSQQPTPPIVWGRLCALYAALPSLDMMRDISYTVGRSPSCNICLTEKELPRKWLNVMSKTHFRIYRERIEGTNETVVFLEDMSYNGTFVDQNLVGRGKRVIIGNNSEIALVKNFFTGTLPVNDPFPGNTEVLVTLTEVTNSVSRLLCSPLISGKESVTGSVVYLHLISKLDINYSV